jgi:hypothetical protein
LFNICYCNSGFIFKSKNQYITAQNYMYFIRENSKKLSQKRKSALWMRHLAPSMRMQSSSKVVHDQSLNLSFVMVNANNGAEPSSESFLAPDGSYVPRILFLDPQGNLLEEVINEKVRKQLLTRRVPCNSHRVCRKKFDSVLEINIRSNHL